MILRIGRLWHCDYTAHPNRQGAVYARTSTNLVDWSDARIVAARGQAGDSPYAAECPFVVEPRPGHYFLFRTQRYGHQAQLSVYYSKAHGFRRPGGRAISIGTSSSFLRASATAR